MWLLIGGVVLAGMSILLFAMVSMAQSEERLAREAERELESITSGAVYAKPAQADASLRKAEPEQAVRDQRASGKFIRGNGGPNHQPSEEEALA